MQNFRLEGVRYHSSQQEGGNHIGVKGGGYCTSTSTKARRTGPESKQ
jgi:hypothetical protein